MSVPVQRIALLAAIVLVAAIYFLFDARYVPGFPPCLFHRFTGLFCPGCGSQRATSALLHGHVASAMGYNVLLVLFAPMLLVAGLFALAAKQPQSWQRLLYNKWFSRAVVLLVTVFWIARNLPLYPFNLLAPHP